MLRPGSRLTLQNGDKIIHMSIMGRALNLDNSPVFP